MRILFRCDDAGSMLSATQAIVSAVRDGVGRCVSVMVPGGSFQPSLPLLRQLADDGIAELGLHIVLNSEWQDHPEGKAARWGPVLPPSRVPSLVYPDGTFKRIPKEHLDARASLDEMALEVAAQLDAALAAGLRLTYADEHMGVGWLPGLRDKLRAVVTARGLRYAEAAPLQPLPQVEAPTPAPSSRPAAPSHPPAVPWDSLAARIRAAPEGDYLVVTHPCLDTPEARGMCSHDLPPGKVAAERESERAMLCHPAVRDALRQRDARLICYRDILP